MRRTIFILATCVFLVVGLVIPSYADIGFSSTSNAQYTYSDNYNITISTDNSISFDDNGGGQQIFPSLRFGSQNSVVNALYQGSTLQLRKATQNVSTNVSTNAGGRAVFYTEYTNLTNVNGYELTITLPVFTLGDLEDFDSLYLYLTVNGTIQECYFSFQMLTTEYNSGQSYIGISEPLEGSLDHLVGTTGGNLITGDLNTYINNLIPDHYIDASAIGDWYIYNLTIEMYVVTPVSNKIVSYTVGQDYRTYPPTPPSMTVRSPEQPPVLVDSDIVGWLGDCVEAVLNTPIFPVAGGYITIGTVVWATMGVGLVMMFIKFFAGG